MGICEHCRQPLRRFTVNFDWDRRCLHKKCWRELEHQKTLKMALDDFIAEQSKQQANRTRDEH